MSQGGVKWNGKLPWEEDFWDDRWKDYEYDEVPEEEEEELFPPRTFSGARHRRRRRGRTMRMTMRMNPPFMRNHPYGGFSIQPSEELDLPRSLFPSLQDDLAGNRAPMISAEGIEGFMSQLLGASGEGGLPGSLGLQLHRLLPRLTSGGVSVTIRVPTTSDISSRNE
eukprot:TRINITY_DN4239_c0_g1_i1.p1 TRINITY_DN4239_c0_g1~~TRINITY_DN4239_c0_g1_i1.p1  ORF type:complete len:167 (-),score=26.28 TRINITY_DN4239_c0_g1_i1:226-726(-)